MGKQIKLLSIFPIILIFSLFIGMMSNLFDLHNPSTSALVILLSTSIILIYYFYRNRLQLSQRLLKKWLVVDLSLIFIIQLLVLHFLPASVFHDPFRVLSQAELISHHQYNWSTSTYFWRYPNNVSLVFLLAKWLQLTTVLNLTTNTSLHLLSIIFLDSFIGLTLLIAIKRAAHSMFSLLLMLFFLISPFAYTYYLQVFYSDLPILLFLLITFIILERWSRLTPYQKIIAGLILFIMMFIGQLIKPNLIVIVVAIGIFGLALLLASQKAARIIIIPLTIMIIGIGAAFPAARTIQSDIHYSQKSQYTMPTLNWIWMSYNPHHKGTYVSSDVQRMNRLPNKTARSNYLKTALIKRLRKLGPIGIVARWFSKLWILLNVGNIQTSYTAGLIEVPAWYRSWQEPASLIGAIIMRTAFTLLYLNGIFACVTLLKKSFRQQPSIPILATIVSVGYVAFHVLVWETESRYGQVLLPLLLFICISETPQIQISAVHSLQFRRWQRLCLSSLLAVCIGAVGFVVINYHSILSPHAPIIATQSSELSMQYHTRLQTINKGTTVSQKIRLTQPASNIALFMPAAKSFNARLVNSQNGRRYSFISSNHRFRVNRPLSAGTYTIIVTSRQNHNSNLEITQTINYHLAPYPLKVNNQIKQHSSFIYVVKGIKS